MARALNGTAGEPPAKRVKRTHRGRRSSATQEKRDQRNEWYFPGSFAFAWLAQDCGTTCCNVDSASDRNDPSTEAERGICGTGETTSGSPHDAPPLRKGLFVVPRFLYFVTSNVFVSMFSRHQCVNSGCTSGLPPLFARVLVIRLGAFIHDVVLVFSVRLCVSAYGGGERLGSLSVNCNWAQRQVVHSFCFLSLFS